MFNLENEIGLNHYLILSALLFTAGMLPVLLRRNVIVVLMGVELMLNAVNLTLVSFSHFSGQADGQVLAFFVMTVAAAEAGVGLALAIVFFKRYKKLNVDSFSQLRG